MKMLIHLRKNIIEKIFWHLVHSFWQLLQIVQIQVLKNDSKKYVVDVKHSIEYAKESRVIVEMKELENETN